MENKLMEWNGSSIGCITEHGGFQSVCLDIIMGATDSTVSDSAGTWKKCHKWTCTQVSI